MNYTNNSEKDAQSGERKYIRCGRCQHQKMVNEMLSKTIDKYSFLVVREKLRCQTCGAIGSAEDGRARVLKDDLIYVLNSFKNEEIKGSELIKIIYELSAEGNVYAENYLKTSKLVASLEKKSREGLDRLLNEKPARYRTKRWHDEDTGLTTSRKSNGKGMYFTPGKNERYS